MMEVMIVSETPVQSPRDIESLIDRYTEPLMRVAYSLGFGDTEAEELTQATFCAYLEGASRFENRSKLSTYLFGILYNKARETRRQQSRHESIDALVDQTFDNHFDAGEHWNVETMDQMSEVEKKVQTTELATLLQECLNGLSMIMRMAFTLKEVECLDSKRICLALDLTPTNLGVTLFRARNKLRECLIARGTVIT